MLSCFVVFDTWVNFDCTFMLHKDCYVNLNLNFFSPQADMNTVTFLASIFKQCLIGSFKVFSLISKFSSYHWLLPFWTRQYFNFSINILQYLTAFFACTHNLRMTWCHFKDHHSWYNSSIVWSTLHLRVHFNFCYKVLWMICWFIIVIMPKHVF